MEILGALEHWHSWLAIAFLILIVELMSGTFFLLALAGGAMLTAAVSWMVDITITLQMVSYAICSGISYMILISFRIEKESEITDGTNHMIGQTVEVIEDTQQRGRVNYKGVLWQATSDHKVRAGDYAEIIAVDGSTLTIKAIHHKSTEETAA